MRKLWFIAFVVFACFGALSESVLTKLEAEALHHVYGLLQRCQIAKNSNDMGQWQGLEVILNSVRKDSKMEHIVEKLLQKPRWEEERGFAFYDLVIKEPKALGILFQEHGKWFRVQEMSATGLGKLSGKVEIGDELVGINFESLSNVDLYDFGELLSNLPLPRLLHFRRNTQQRQQEAAAAHKPKPKPAPPKQQQQQQKPPLGHKFTVIVQKKSMLGLRLLDDLEIDGIKSDSPCAGQVEEGDHLVGINGVDVSKMDLEAAVGLIRSTKAPLVLEFYTKRSGGNAPGNVASEEVEKIIQKAQESSQNAQDYYGGTGELVLASPPILAGSRYPIQFAEFGEPPSCGVQNLTVREASSRFIGMGCKRKRADADPYPANSIVFVLRGECTFVTKARNAFLDGAQGLIVISRDFEPVVAMPAGAHELRAGPIPMPVGMLAWKDGSSLAGLLKSGPLQGIVTGPGCGHNVESLLEQANGGENGPEEEDFSMETLRDGQQKPRYKVSDAVELLIWSSATGTSVSFFAIFAKFGPTKYDEFQTVMKAEPAVAKFAPEPRDACAPLTGGDYKGAIVIAYRGVCPFGDKAVNIQNAGGRFMILIDKDNPERSKLVPMITPPDSSASIRISGAMITSKDGEILRNLLEPGSDKTDADDQHHHHLDPPKETILTVAKVYRKSYYYCNRKKGFVCGIDPEN